MMHRGCRSSKVDGCAMWLVHPESAAQKADSTSSVELEIFRERVRGCSACIATLESICLAVDVRGISQALYNHAALCERQVDENDPAPCHNARHYEIVVEAANARRSVMYM